MGTTRYDPGDTARHFDEAGLAEWERLTATPADEVSLYLHSHYLARHIRAGMRVLEVGAGAGRFTQVLAGLGARVRVADLSAGQLALNRRFAAQLGFAGRPDSAKGGVDPAKGGIDGWDQVDICDLGRYADASFDAVVAYGGPLSYVLDRRDLALRECLRVLAPGGVLLLSVMSLWGTVHWALKGVLAVPPANNRRIFATGDLIPENVPRQGNSMHLFRSGELRAWLEAAGVEILDLSACFCLSPGWNESLRELREDAEKWNELLGMELEASASPGCLDMGTHLITVVRKP